MKNESRNIKIGVFIDGNYLLHTSNYYNYIHTQKRRLSIGGLSRFVVGKVAQEENCDKKSCMVVESHYFRGRLNATDASQKGNQLYNDRVFDDILVSEGVEGHYLPLRNLYGRKEARGIDVWLSLEAFEKAIVKQLDYVALVVSDTDYLPLVRKLTSLGVKTILLSWEFEYINEDGQKVVTKTSQELLNNATYPIDVYDIIERGSIDENEVNTDDLFVNHTLIKAYYDDAYIDDINENAEVVDDNEMVEVSEVLSLKQGYGFIKYPNNNLFFHFHDVVGDFLELEQNDTVEFILGKGSEGQDVAKRIKKIKVESIGDAKNSDLDTFDWNAETNTFNI